MNQTFDIDELIARRLAAEIDVHDDALLDEWLAASSDNRVYFSQMQRVWQHAEMGKNLLSKPLDVEAALARTKSKIQQAPVKNTRKIVPFRSWWFAIAASLSLLAAAVWFFKTSSGDTPVVLAATTQILRDTLVDGSVVNINQHSTLTAEFSKKARRIKLRGEAYFAVAHDAAKPFTIDVNKVEVTVLGTKFNIDNRSDSNKVVVSVEEGKVRVQLGSQTLFLTVGEQATVDCMSGQILVHKLPASGNIKGWFDRRFAFDDVPLSEVLPILEKAYNVRIELKNKDLGKCRLHTHFNDEPIDRVLELIAETFNMQIESNNGRYQLDGVGCQ